jgi:outer membrane receptor protein involved in Fe transport
MNRRHAGLLACCLVLSAATTHAQTTASETKEAPIVLSPFEVKADENRGYVASETVTGSRVKTKIVDLPYTVNVITSEFFDDFALFELADNLVHVGSFTGLDIGGGFTLRGFGSTSQLRDGFYRLGRYGSSNIDSMEIIKGSNAAIYGRTSPGGMVNMISKQPKAREYYKLNLNYGDYGTRRGVFEATGRFLPGLLGDTNYIFTASEYEREFDMDWALNRNHEYYLALKHTFADNSTLLLSAEYFKQIRRAPTSSAPMITDLKGTASNLDDEVIGYAKNLAGYNAFGPHSQLDRGNTGLNFVYEKRLNRTWSARAAGNYYQARRWDYNQNTGFGAITINSPTASANLTSTRGTTPNRGLIFEDGGGLQADLLAHYWTSGRAVEHRTLATLDFNDYYRWDPTRNSGATAALAAWQAAGSGRIVSLNPDYTPVAPLTYFNGGLESDPLAATYSRLTRRRTTVLGGLLRHQSAFMNGRLLAYAGARFDAVRFQERDYTTAVASFRVFPGYANYNQGDMIARRVNQLKPNFGVNYKLTSGLRVFANYSESYFVNQTDNPIVFADPTYKPEIANGYDYGFKGAYFDERLNFTVSGFYAIRENVSVTEVVESPPGSGLFITENRRDGDQLVRGYEVDLNWTVSDEINVGGSYGNVNSIYTDFGSAFPLAVGRKVNNVSPENGSAYIKYSPKSGRLKGFSANLGVTFVAETPTEAPNAGDTYTTTSTGERVLTRTTRQWALTVPDVTLWNVGVRYSWRNGSRLDHTVALNLNNIFDEDYLKVNRQLGERRAFYLTYSLGFSGKPSN